MRALIRPWWLPGVTETYVLGSGGSFKSVCLCHPYFSYLFWLKSVRSGATFCHMHKHKWGGSPATRTFLFVQQTCKIIHVYVFVCECVCSQAFHPYPHGTSPLWQLPHNDFQPVLNSILPAFSRYLLHISTPPHQQALFTAREASLDYIVLHCMRPHSIITYWLLLCNPAREENAVTARRRVGCSGWRQSGFIISAVSPFTARSSWYELLMAECLYSGQTLGRKIDLSLDSRD